MFGLFGKKKLSSILSHFEKDKQNLEQFIEKTGEELVSHKQQMNILTEEKSRAERVLTRVKSILGDEE